MIDLVQIYRTNDAIIYLGYVVVCHDGIQHVNKTQEIANGIVKCMNTLKKLEQRTIAPNLKPYQYIGSVVDNVSIMLASAACLYDGKTRIPTSTKIENTESFISGISRYYYSNIHAATEKSIIELCKQHGYKPISSERKAWDKLINKIKRNEEIKIKLLERTEKTFKPSFKNYLECLLNNKLDQKDEKTKWKNFFECLTILRHKASHPNTKLTKEQKEKMITQGFKGVLDRNGEITLKCNVLEQVASHILDFFDIILKKNTNMIR